MTTHSNFDSDASTLSEKLSAKRLFTVKKGEEGLIKTKKKQKCVSPQNTPRVVHIVISRIRKNGLCALYLNNPKI